MPRIDQDGLRRGESRNLAAHMTREKLGFAGLKASRAGLLEALKSDICHLSHPVWRRRQDPVNSGLTEGFLGTPILIIGIDILRFTARISDVF